MNKLLELDAVELTNPQVVRVSLVDRGANRSPIRKLKSEDTMKKNLDLSNLSSLLVQKAAEAPVTQDVVAAIVSLKGEACDNFCAALEAEGVVAVKKFETEVGTTLIFDESADLSDATTYSTVEVSGDVAVVLKGFSPWSLVRDMESPFMEAIKARGYFSDVYRATEMLMERFEMVSDDARSKEQFTASVMPLIEDFSSYVKALTEALPDVAFKMATKAAELAPAVVEPVVVEAEVTAETQEAPADVTTPEVEEPAGESDAEKTTEAEESKPETEEESAVVVDEVPAEPVVTESASTEGDTVEVVKADEAELTGLALIQAALTKMEEKQTETFQKFDERLTNLSEKVTTKAASRTTGAVAATPPQITEESSTTTVKKDASLSLPIDTGYRSLSKT